ncbi:MAG: YajG family lipoprotein [Pseudomonadota bacterium]
MDRILSLFIAIFALSLIGCAQERPYQVTNLILGSQLQGRGYITEEIELGLQVSDMRTNQHIGYRRFGFEKESPIHLDNVAPAMLKTLTEDLKQLGFQPVSYGVLNKRSMDVQILSVHYDKKARVVAGEEKIIIKADVVVKKEEQYLQRSFEISHVDNDFFKPSATHQNQQIDETLSRSLEKIIHKIVNDGQIIAFLRGY